MSIKVLLVWILTFFNNTDIKKITNPILLKSEIQQLQQTAPENFFVNWITRLFADLNKLFSFLQIALLEMFNELANAELKELEELNTQFSTIPFSEIRAKIQEEKVKADETTLSVLENFEKTIQLLEKIAFETKQLSTEKQPDYEEVMLKILERDIASGGTIARGKKAVSKFFAED